MKIYLAGPDVFRADAKVHGELLKAFCRNLGAEGLYPIDNDVDLKSSMVAIEIYRGNKKMLQTCDAVVANIEPFRGPGMDAGTAWEIGYAAALGKPVFAYTINSSEYAQRVGFNYGDFPRVEDFGLVENLMITSSVQGIYNDVCAAIRAAVNGGER